VSRCRIPSVIALVLGFVLVVNANRLAGPKLPDGSRDERGFVIHTAASMGGVLICVFALAEMLYSVRKAVARAAVRACRSRFSRVACDMSGSPA
jgi:hypothetical protein